MRCRLRRRSLIVQAVRELDRDPLHPLTLQIRPDLRRGPVLITGYDLESHERRSFYLSSARRIVEHDDREFFRLAIFDPTHDAPPEFFGSPFLNSRADVAAINELRARLNARLSQSQSIQVVEVFRWRP